MGFLSIPRITWKELARGIEIVLEDHSFHKNDLARDGGAVGAGVPRYSAGKHSPGRNREDPGVKDMEPFFIKGERDES